MSETLPRPIEPQDIRVGDRVRMTQVCEGDTLTGEFTVTHNAGRFLSTSGAGAWDADYEYRTWTLLDRPEPEPARPVGSHWRDPETGAEYVATDTGRAEVHRYKRGLSESDVVLVPGYSTSDTEIIARLVPIPAFDPAALWPQAAEDEMTCGEKGAGWYCCRPAGHDPLHVAYAGSRPIYLWGNPR